MDNQVKNILVKFGVPQSRLSQLEHELFKENIIIYKSQLPKLTEQPVLNIDATPDEDYPLRILRAYRQGCNCQWLEDVDGKEPTNPLLKAMNKDNGKRKKILDEAIKKLSG